MPLVHKCEARPSGYDRKDDQQDQVNIAKNDTERLQRCAAEKTFDSTHLDFNQRLENISFSETLFGQNFPNSVKKYLFPMIFQSQLNLFVQMIEEFCSLENEKVASSIASLFSLNNLK